MATHGMVATSQPLAAQAGLSVLQQGGNAIDAAIATAAALTVVEPTSNGIGSDAFALVWTGGRLYGLNASGWSPAGLNLETAHRAGLNEMPRWGWFPVTVPGAPAAWAELSGRFGRLPLTKTLAPAIEYAEAGYPVSPVLGHFWQRAYATYQKNLQGEAFAEWFRVFAPEGRAPAIGEVWRSADHARTLRQIAESGARAFYEGELAERIVHFAQQTDGFFTLDDFAEYRPEWVDPIHVSYRGYDVWELPPNGQGLVALMALNILSGFELSIRESVEAQHLAMEAVKLAFADGRKFITDARELPVRVEDLLSPAYAAQRRAQIGHTALEPSPGRPPAGGTVYLATADGEGNMVSFIQSNYMGFGSGLVVPETGIALQNRGHSFSLKTEDANCLRPRKRPYHTIIPGFLTKNGQPLGPFGVMGGFMQPQGHVQVLMNLLDFHLNPQAALDAPRWQWVEGRRIDVEPTWPMHLVQALARRGHDLRVARDGGAFGRGQIILRQGNVLIGATEPRTDGSIAAF
ncbi:MAG: gamma-glutamyltransferase family protein [Alicyclobacillus herbarius]|uniref:gamma-glutamyltransferase family protein n=1 Tax=Alicyclobacillus herbarius TaxID=122960 RepID=UPI0023548F21|nr:gamma-glutamyltransferase family protein [Alicyclobacillus herbarius]MCL6632625.1 gamma-glutamyltransferase family protein [Alicyclobacillus herbarius]